MKKNSVFAATSLLLAGAVVGAGAMISGVAMADSGRSPETAEVTVGVASTSGDVVECALAGAEAQEFLLSFADGAAPSEVDVDYVFGRTEIGSAETMAAEEAARVDVSEGADATVVGSDGPAVSGPAVAVDPTKTEGSYLLAVPAQIEATTEVDGVPGNGRVGTPEECKVILEAAPGSEARPEAPKPGK